MVEKTIELTGMSTNSIEDGQVTAWRVRVHVTFAVQDRVHE